MKVELELNEEQVAELAGVLMSGMLAEGIALRAPERTAPFSKAEAADELGVSEATVVRWIEAGKLRKIEGTGRVLIPVKVVRKVQEGGAE